MNEGILIYRLVKTNLYETVYNADKKPIRIDLGLWEIKTEHFDNVREAIMEYCAKNYNGALIFTNLTDAVNTLTLYNEKLIKAVDELLDEREY